METAAPAELIPWFGIWTTPRRTLHWILARDSQTWVLGLAALSGFTESLDRASSSDFGDSVSLPGIFGISLVVGSISGVIGLYIMAFLLRWTGGWLGGCGSAKEIRAAVAAPNLLSAWGLLLWIPLLVFVGEELFTSEAPRLAASSALRALVYGTTALGLVLAGWYIVVALACLSEAQRFSIWKALANVVLAFLVVFLPILLLLLLLLPWNLA